MTKEQLYKKCFIQLLETVRSLEFELDNAYEPMFIQTHKIEREVLDFLLKESK